MRTPVAAAAHMVRSKIDISIPSIKMHDDELVSTLVLFAGYLLATAHVLYQVIYAKERFRSGLTRQKIFFTVTAFVALVRCIYFAILPFTYQPLALSGRYPLHSINIWELITMAVNDLPAYVFISVFCLLILYWAEIVDRVRTPAYSSARTLQPFFLVCNFLMYSWCAVAWSLLWYYRRAPPALRWLAHVQLSVFAGVCIGAAAAFLAFGIRLLSLLRRVQSVTSSHQGSYSDLLRRRIWEVRVLTIVGTVSYVARACLLLLCNAKSSGEPVDPVQPAGGVRLAGASWVGCQEQPYFVLAYYGLLEVVPLLMMFHVLREIPRTSPIVLTPAGLQPSRSRELPDTPLLDGLMQP